MAYDKSENIDAFDWDNVITAGKNGAAFVGVIGSAVGVLAGTIAGCACGAGPLASILIGVAGAVTGIGIGFALGVIIGFFSELNRLGYFTTEPEAPEYEHYNRL